MQQIRKILNKITPSATTRTQPAQYTHYKGNTKIAREEMRQNNHGQPSRNSHKNHTPNQLDELKMSSPVRKTATNFKYAAVQRSGMVHLNTCPSKHSLAQTWPLSAFLQAEKVLNLSTTSPHERTRSEMARIAGIISSPTS